MDEASQCWGMLSWSVGNARVIMWQAVINISKHICDIGPTFYDSYFRGFLIFFFSLGLSRLTRSLDCLLNGESQTGPAPEGNHGGTLYFWAQPGTHCSGCWTQPPQTALSLLPSDPKLCCTESCTVPGVSVDGHWRMLAKNQLEQLWRQAVTLQCPAGTVQPLGHSHSAQKGEGAAVRTASATQNTGQASLSTLASGLNLEHLSLLYPSWRETKRGTILECGSAEPQPCAGSGKVSGLRQSSLNVL